MGTCGSHLHCKKKISFSLVHPSFSSILPFMSEKLNNKLEETASLFSNTENNLKHGQAMQRTNSSLVGEHLDLESNGKSSSSKYLEPSIVQKEAPALSATLCFFAQICKNQQALEGKRGHILRERTNEQARGFLTTECKHTCMQTCTHSTVSQSERSVYWRQRKKKSQWSLLKRNHKDWSCGRLVISPESFWKL